MPLRGTIGNENAFAPLRLCVSYIQVGTLTMSRQKIAIIGWDSATFDVVLPLAEAGALPNLSRLMARGAWGKLRSTIHPLSPTAWASFMTGTNPGQHGVYDFVCLGRNGQFQVSNGGQVAQPSLWAQLSAHGRRVAVLNVPMTYPPAQVNGYLVAGMDTPFGARDYTFPRELLAQIEATAGPYVIDLPVRGAPWQSIQQFTAEYVRKLCASVEQQAEVVRHLATQDDLDFFTAVFTAPDRVQHALGHLLAQGVTPEDGIGRVYQACDAATGRILEALGDDWVVLLMSDHGACAYSQVFEPNAWLQQRHLLTMQPAPRWQPLADLMAPVQRRVALRTGWVRPPRSHLERHLSRIDWSRTQAFAVGAFGSIYVNDRSRFGHGRGIVEPGRAVDALCDEIGKGLLALKDPETSAPMVRAVYRSRDIYSGDQARWAPDLLLDVHEDYFVRNALDHQQGPLVVPAARYGGRSLAHTGRHTMDGILVAAGVPFQAGANHAPAAIIDLAPTVLYLNGLPVPAAMDGRPLLDWLEAGYVTQHPVVQQAAADHAAPAEADSAYTVRDAAIVEQHLRSLGYLN